jgi:hypothetical protein
MLWPGLLLSLAVTALSASLWLTPPSPSRAGYDKIQNGMTKAEVEQLIGRAATAPVGLLFPLDEFDFKGNAPTFAGTQPGPPFDVWDWSEGQICATARSSGVPVRIFDLGIPGLPSLSPFRLRLGRLPGRRSYG